MCAQRQSLEKKSKKEEKRQSKYARLSECYVNDPTDIEILYISPLTQVFVGCRIGEDITVRDPWIYIEKEKVLDHLDLYTEESEFFPIQDQITNYPETQLMIGSCSYNEDIPVEFYVCTTVKAQQAIEEMIKLKNEMMEQKIHDSIYRACGDWVSLGSEEQITSEMNLNNRELFAVDIESNFPIYKMRPRCCMKLAEEIANGYVELRAGRPSEMQFLWRRRIDRGTQVTPFKINVGAQTQSQGRFRQIMQYNYECPPFKQTQLIIKKLDEFFHAHLTPICDKLLVNYHMNLYNDDYIKLKKHFMFVLVQKPVDIKLYQDIYCRRTKVNCMSCNAIISGVVAAAYSRNPLLCLSKRIHLESVKDPAAENHLILIWHYKDNVRPKLYLHAKSEVTALSFCPYNENILVAGYSNGQIAVWDLTNHLVESEPPTFYTESEQQYHTQIMDLTSWIKRPLGFEHLFPVLTSELQLGNTSAVTSIAWLPPTHYISEMRHYMECEDGVMHMQFFTVTLDGNKILVWDLQPSEYQTTIKKRRAKYSRLATIPNALTMNISPLRQLQDYFKPICRLFINAPKSHQNKNPLIKMVMKNELYQYNVLNPGTLQDIEALTYFKMNTLAFGFDTTQKIILTTGLGVLQIAFWEGADYKDEINQELCKIDTLATVHDGPIIVCELNTFFPDMILTVGGSVFAIWDHTKTKDALVWRKSKHRYQSGMWCRNHPLSLLVVRIDRCYEFWNVSEQSSNPIELAKYKGYDLINFYGDSTKFHSRKSTFITTDALGGFKLFSLPSDVANKSDKSVDKALEFINHIHELKRYIEALKEKCRKKMNANLVENPEPLTVPVPEPEPEIQKSDIEKEAAKPDVKISKKVRFERNLIKHMQAIEIRRKKLDITQIKANHLLCLQTKISNIINLNEKLLNPEEVMAEAQEKIVANIILTKKVRRRITMTITREKALELKKMYMEAFEEIEHEMLQIIKKRNYSIKINNQCQNMRDKYEKIAHLEMKHLKREDVVESEADIINVGNRSIESIRST